MAFQVAHLTTVPCQHCGQMVPVTRRMVNTGRCRQSVTGEWVDWPLQAEYTPVDNVHQLRNERQLGIEEPMVIVVRCRLHETGN